MEKCRVPQEDREARRARPLPLCIDKGGEYGPVALVYGGNGRGKTTLCAALRSLQQNAPDLVIDRTSFGSKNLPEVQFLLDSGITTLSKTGWSTHSADIHIFDGQFIAENIHDGRTVDTEQRRNLYLIAVGAQGVALAQALEAIDKSLVGCTSEITNARKVLQQHVPKGFTVEAFVALPIDLAVEEKLKSARSTLLAVTNAAAILDGKTLDSIPIPAVPSGNVALCARTLGNVQADALDMVQAHLAKHALGAEGETWIADGLHGRQGIECPFCGQDLSLSAVVAAYDVYFGEAYAALKEEIDRATAECERVLSEAAGLKCVAAFTSVRERCTFWKSYLEIEPPEEPLAFSETLGSLRDACESMLTTKAQAPMDAVVASGEWESASLKWNGLASNVSAANELVAEINKRIAQLKLSTRPEARPIAESAVARLEAIKVRSREDVAVLVTELAAHEVLRLALQRAKDEAKANLDAHDATVFAQYERSINGFLQQFGANFGLRESSKNYVGKVPQTEYGIEFEKHVVRVGGRGQSGGPGFQTSLSAGDKSALALAFFLAQIERDSAIAKKVVVFDDPFTSLDDFRREVTAKSIARMSDVASQVIVLSHDKHFLHAVRERVHGKVCTTIQISLAASGANIEEWDIDREVKEGYLVDHLKLMEFEDRKSTDARAAVTLMRPLLEKYIRYRFPNAIPDDNWLGDMLAIIRADPAHPLQARYQELDDINEYTAPFHHDPNTPLNEDAVRGYVTRTLKIVGGS